ncbi:MAG TPA: AMIN domain-containing protein, partial [Burkholderiales bacterium]|nr:AMIN domain-containing protein [Burkholderiales bacterium]
MRLACDRSMLVAVCGLLLLCVAPLLCEAAVSISAVRVWPAPEYTRITIESAKPIEYSLFTTKNPDRLVVDLEDVDRSGQLDGLPARIGP